MTPGTINTRIPEQFDPRGGDQGNSVYAWMLDDSGRLKPSGNTDLSPGQAWELDGNGDLVPTGEAITDDPFWTTNGDGDLVPR